METNIPMILTNTSTQYHYYNNAPWDGHKTLLAFRENRAAVPAHKADSPFSVEALRSAGHPLYYPFVTFYVRDADAGR